MKKAAKIVVSIVAIIAILISVVFFLASGMTDTATAFFTAIKAKNYERAYSYLSEDFKTNTSQEELLKYFLIINETHLLSHWVLHN